MPKFELTKSIEARKLNPRTRIPLNDYVSIPFGAIIEDRVREGTIEKFSYLGEFYQYPAHDLEASVAPVK
jgi:hypothetical protein